MKKADAQTLLTLMDELTELMTEYDRRTDRMVTMILKSFSRCFYPVMSLWIKCVR